VPVTLGLILLILAGMLRAVVMPLYVVATVVLSFAFALGASSLLFTHVFGQPASDPNLAQFALIFLVALGVDYNVFLLARIREEREGGLPTRAAVTTALERTGGVITSAGLVLAVTFGVLMALPLESLFQVGFVVALGLLVDTFLVRALLVPALALLLGERNWWPRTPFDDSR
jgi:RND superfamily putative drug exporter